MTAAKHSGMRTALTRLAGALLACLALAPAALAQSYPSRQIRLVVPFAAGGPADLLARVIAQEMSNDLGQQVFVDIGRAPTPSSAPTSSPRPSPTATRS